MLKKSRLFEIKKILERETEVQTTELSKRFGVSEMTIRRDIDELAKEVAIIKTRGGAYLAPIGQQNEPSYSYRSREASDIKDKLAAKAAEIMADHLNVYLDSGTTTEYVLRHLQDNKRYMIITNGINIAQESVNYNHISTFLIGGEFRTNTLSTNGAAAEDQLKRFRYDVSFLGANAIDSNGNAYVGTTVEVGLKHCVIENSSKCYILADSSKFEKYSLVSYTNLQEISGVITDAGISQEVLQALRNKNINVIIAE